MPKFDLSSFFKSRAASVRQRRSSTVDSFGQAASVAFATRRRIGSRSSLASPSHERESVVVSLNNPQENRKREFCSNYVSTTRYCILLFSLLISEIISVDISGGPLFPKTSMSSFVDGYVMREILITLL